MKKIFAAMIVVSMTMLLSLTEGQMTPALAGGGVAKAGAKLAAEGLKKWAKDPETWQRATQGVASKSDALAKSKDLWDKTDPLDPSDASSEPSYDQPGMPEVPTACYENKDCYYCYEKANDKIADLRYSFEKLRILYKQTDEFVKAAIAFGDGVSGMTHYGAIQWTKERMKIQKSFKNFEAAYRKKHNQLVNELKDALEKVAECEKKYFGEEDWYARYGFMFHSFIAMHYQR